MADDAALAKVLAGSPMMTPWARRNAKALPASGAGSAGDDREFAEKLAGLKKWWNEATPLQRAPLGLAALPFAMGEGAIKAIGSGINWGARAAGGVNAEGQPLDLSNIRGTPEADTDGGFGLVTALALGGLAAPPMKNAAGMGIRAYHGSPHDFDKFEWSPKTRGTGEGAQAYGDGLYFAESEGVAKSYRDALAKTNASFDGVSVVDAFMDGSLAGRVSEKFGLPKGDAIEVANVLGTAVRTGRAPLEVFDEKAAGSIKLLQDAGVDAKGEIDRLARLREAVAQSGVQPKPGRMYEVDINANPEQFLDWDKPLSEQPAVLQEYLKKADLSHLPPGGRLRRTIEAHRKNPGDWTPPEGANIPEPTGNEIHSALTDYGKNPGRNAELTQRMKEAGIPGIKFLDQGSRAVPETVLNERKRLADLEAAVRADPSDEILKGNLEFTRSRLDSMERLAAKGTSNFVVFDENLITIMRKYGIPLTASGMAIAETLFGGTDAQAAPQENP